jgi:hypothetical protein
MVLAACGTSAKAGGGEPSLPAAIYAGAVTANVEYADGGIILKVPPTSANARASWSDAYVASCMSGDAICDVGKKPMIFLAVATIGIAGEAQKDGSLRPVVEDKLVFVMQYTNVPCTGSGPPRRKERTTPTMSFCTVLNFIDADSGRVLYSVQGPALEPLN